jgi:hypothetical protein
LTGPRMTKPIARDAMYRRRSFDADVIELCVRWYITYLCSAKTPLSAGSYEGVFMMQPAKDGIGTDGI